MQGAMLFSLGFPYGTAFLSLFYVAFAANSHRRMQTLGSQPRRAYLRPAVAPERLPPVGSALPIGLRACGLSSAQSRVGLLDARTPLGKHKDGRPLADSLAVIGPASRYMALAMAYRGRQYDKTGRSQPSPKRRRSTHRPRQARSSGIV